MKKLKRIIWIIIAISFFVWVAGMACSLIGIPAYLTYEMIVKSSFALLEFLKIVGVSLLCYFAFAVIALLEYIFLVSHYSWVRK